MDVGGVVSNVSKDAASVNPAFRSAISDMTITLSWNETATVSDINTVLETLEEQLQPLRDISPSGGQYVNEVSVSLHLP